MEVVEYLTLDQLISPQIDPDAISCCRWREALLLMITRAGDPLKKWRTRSRPKGDESTFQACREKD
jgi:hypothetical protein